MAIFPELFFFGLFVFKHENNIVLNVFKNSHNNPDINKVFQLWHIRFWPFPRTDAFSYV